MPQKKIANPMKTDTPNSLVETLRQKAARRLNKWSAKLNPPKELTPIEREVLRFVDVNGDKTLRLHYPELNQDSVVFDIGGYHGQWASDIYAKYKCRVLVFEPAMEFYKLLALRFEKNPDIEVYPFGLGGSTCETTLYLDNDASSLYVGPDPDTQLNQRHEVVRVVSMADFLAEKGIHQVDLAKINIEGAEYDLLEHMIERDVLKRFVNLQIQFHEFVVDSRQKTDKIRAMLERTHTQQWCYEFIWENWQRKPV